MAERRLETFFPLVFANGTSWTSFAGVCSRCDAALPADDLYGRVLPEVPDGAPYRTPAAREVDADGLGPDCKSRPTDDRRAPSCVADARLEGPPAMSCVSSAYDRDGFCLYGRATFLNTQPLGLGPGSVHINLDEQRASTLRDGWTYPQADLHDLASSSEAQLAHDVVGILNTLSSRFACGSHEDCRADRRLARACWEDGRDVSRLPAILEELARPFLAEIARLRLPTFEDFYINSYSDPRGVMRRAGAPTRR